MIQKRGIKKITIIVLSIMFFTSLLTIIPQVNADIITSKGSGWADVERAWFAKTRHGGAGGFRASVGVDPASSQGQDGWFAGGWTWESGTTYHFILEYDFINEIAELFVEGQNGGNPLCTYNVGPSEGKIGINARTAPDAGKSTIIENIKFNGLSISPYDAVTATSDSGEIAVEHILIEGANLKNDFTLEGDFTFYYDSLTYDECPSMVIDVENNYERLCTIHFVTPFRGLDGDISGWSTGNNMVNLSTGTWSLLNGNASVTGYARNKLSYFLTQRGTRGLGINGNEDDEIDSYGRPEVVDVTFFKPYFVDYLEVRSLFDEWWGIEEGEIELWRDGSIIDTIHLLGIEPIGGSNNGRLGVEVTPPKIIDKIIFWVPPNQPYTPESEFAVAKINLIEIEPPVADANGPYSGHTIDTITLDGSGSFDPDGQIVNYKWLVDDFEVYSGPDSTYNLDLISYSEGLHDVELIVTDNFDLSDNDSSTLDVILTPPIADAGGPYHSYYEEDYFVRFDGSSSYDPDGYIVNWSWDFGDGTAGFGEFPTHTYEYHTEPLTITLTVTDNDGLQDTDETSVSFYAKDELPPIVQIITPEENEYITGNYEIKWYAIDDDLSGENLPIYLYYCPKGMDDFHKIIGPISNNIDIEHGSYNWNVNGLSNGEYTLLVEADGTGGIGFDNVDVKVIGSGTGMAIDVSIFDKTIDSYQYVKDGDSIKISAAITGYGSSKLKREDITANLEAFGYGSKVIAYDYNGFEAIWELNNLKNLGNGLLHATISVNDISKTASITADNTDPDITVEKPLKGLYFYNSMILSKSITTIIGPIDIKLDLFDNSGIEKVEILIDGEQIKIIENEPFEYYMNKKLIGKHKLGILAYDNTGNKNEVSEIITFFNFFGT